MEMNSPNTAARPYRLEPVSLLCQISVSFKDRNLIFDHLYLDYNLSIALLRIDVNVEKNKNKYQLNEENKD